MLTAKSFSIIPNSVNRKYSILSCDISGISFVFRNSLKISLSQPKWLSVVNRVSTPFTIRLLETTHAIELLDGSKWPQIFKNKSVRIGSFFTFFQKPIINLNCFRIIFLLVFFKYVLPEKSVSYSRFKRMQNYILVNRISNSTLYFKKFCVELFTLAFESKKTFIDTAIKILTYFFVIYVRFSL